MSKVPKNKNSTRYFSSVQENTIAKSIGGKTQAGSGSAKFYAGDVITNDFLIEAKTTTKPKESFSIKKEWITKNNLERMQLGKPYCALAFQFAPNSPNYYVIDEKLFKKLLEYMEGDCL
jgi:hypothetical protein